MGATITALKQTAAAITGRVKYILLPQSPPYYSAAVKTQNFLAFLEFLNIQCIGTEESK